MAVSTDKKKIDRLLSRRVVEAVVEKSLREKLESGRKLRIKFGADPSSPDLHLGHAVVLKKLREFQELGHQVVFIVGDTTAMIGDPSGKSKTRPILTAEEVDRNAETYLAQVGKILDTSKVEVRRNSEWFGKLGFEGVLRLASNFTVARMIERDDFEKRLGEGTDVHMHELLYPMMQAYDSIMIDADVEIGGTDQKFNILAGRDLQRKSGKPEQDCLFLGPTLVGTDGAKKMSKSLGNYVGIADAPDDMFGKTMSIPDAVLWDWFLLATDLEETEIAAMRAACEKGEMNPRDVKARLGREIVTEYHSAAAAAAAEEKFASMFRDKEAPEDAPVVAMEGGMRKLVDVLVETKLASSKGEARRLIAQGGVRVAGEAAEDPEAVVAVGDEPVLVQKGKRGFVKVKAK